MQKAGSETFLQVDEFTDAVRIVLIKGFKDLVGPLWND